MTHSTRLAIDQELPTPNDSLFLPWLSFDLPILLEGPYLALGVRPVVQEATLLLAIFPAKPCADDIVRMRLRHWNAKTYTLLEQRSKLSYLLWGWCINCSRRDMYNHPPLGIVSRVYVVIDEDGKYDYQVLLFSKEKGCISTVDDYLPSCGQISSKGGYKFCPGIYPDMYKTAYHIIQYDPKSLRRTVHHILAQTSKEC